jgi:hypothetical protein
MFRYRHDVMHIKGFWMAENRWLRRWFSTAVIPEILILSRSFS